MTAPQATYQPQRALPCPAIWCMFLVRHGRSLLLHLVLSIMANDTQSVKEARPWLT